MCCPRGLQPEDCGERLLYVTVSETKTKAEMRAVLAHQCRVSWHSGDDPDERGRRVAKVLTGSCMCDR